MTGKDRSKTKTLTRDRSEVTTELTMNTLEQCERRKGIVGPLACTSTLKISNFRNQDSPISVLSGFTF